MLTIYIARHGQNVDNADGLLNGHRDLPLTTIGVQQAAEAAAKLKTLGIVFDAIYTSPLVRASHTAKIIAEVTNSSKPIVLASLIERDFGDLTGVAQSRIKELCEPDIICADKMVYFLAPPNGETFPQLLKRAQTVLADVRAAHHEGAVLLVCHMDIGNMIYAAYYNLAWRAVLDNFYFGNSEVLKLSPDSAPEAARIFSIQQFNT